MAGRQNPQPKQQSERVLYVGNWYRSLNTELITMTGACTKTPCWGVQFARAPRFIEFARATAAAVGRYTCVQWRSETKANSLNVEECARKLVRSTSHAWQMQSAGGYSADPNAPVLLVTDLYEGASSTYGASRNQKTFSLALKVRSKHAFESLCVLVFYFIMWCIAHVNPFFFKCSSRRSNTIYLVLPRSPDADTCKAARVDIAKGETAGSLMLHLVSIQRWQIIMPRVATAFTTPCKIRAVE